MTTKNTPTANTLLESKIHVEEEDNIEPNIAHTAIITGIEVTFKQGLISIRTEYRLDNPKCNKCPIYSYAEIPIDKESIDQNHIDEVIFYKENREISPSNPYLNLIPIDSDRLMNLFHRIGTHCSIKVTKHALIKSVVIPVEIINPN